MQIKNIEGLTLKEINRELEHGARFVIYQYSISIIVMSFRNSSDIYFVRSHESRVAKGWLYILISFFLGWWGFPWGLIYTVGSLYTNFSGGKDVTAEIIASLNEMYAEPEPQLQ